MMINIATGNAISQMKLFLCTNKFFNSPRLSNLITKNDENFVVEIRKKTICILLSSSSKESDYQRIKTYIEQMFKGRSILIDTDGCIDWLKDVKNVKIRTI